MGTRVGGDDGFVAAPIKVTRAYEVLALEIRDRILAGGLSEGERLPSEASLAAQARVGRSTVREALRLLQEAGFVERVSPKVLVVRARPREPLHGITQVLRRSNVTFQDLHEAMLAIDPELARLASQRADAGDIDQLAQILRNQERVLDRVDDFNTLDEEFHTAIARMSGNLALLACRVPITEMLLPTLHDFMRAGPMPEQAMKFHRHIFEQIEVGDPEGAALAARRHINDFRKAWEAAGNSYDASLGELVAAERAPNPIGQRLSYRSTIDRSTIG